MNMYKDYKDCIVFVVPVKWHKKFQAGIWSQVVRPHLDRIMERMDEIEPHLPFILLNLAAWCISYRYILCCFFCLAVCFQQELIKKTFYNTWPMAHPWESRHSCVEKITRISRALSLTSKGGPSWVNVLILFKDVLAKHCGTLLDYFDEAWQSQNRKMKAMGSLWDLCAGFVLDPQWNKQWIYIYIHIHGHFMNLSENELLYLRKWDVHSLSAESLQFRFDPFVNVSI